MNKRNLVEMIRKIISEETTDIRKVDRSKLVSNAGNVLDAFVKNGFVGKYNPSEARGVVKLNGIEIHFTTGEERVYFEISKFSIEGNTANSIVGKLSEIFKVSETGLYLKPNGRKKRQAVKEYYTGEDYNDPIASAKTKGMQSYKDSGSAEADAIEYVGGKSKWAMLTQREKDEILSDIEKDKRRSYNF